MKSYGETHPWEGYMKTKSKWKSSVAIASLLCAQGVLADSGTYESVFSFTYNYVNFEHGDGSVTGGPIHGTVTIIKSSGGPFVAGRSSTVVCLPFVKKSSAGIDLEAPCTGTDSNGDKAFSVSRRKAGDVESGGGGAGRTELVGGTGAYSGVTGSCTYKVEYFPDNRAVTQAKCRWQN